MRTIPAVLLLLLMLVMLTGCSDGPPEFDGRPADILVDVYTTVPFLAPYQRFIVADSVYASAFYPQPWSPNGSGVPAVVIGIENLSISVEGVPLQPYVNWSSAPNHRDIFYHGYRLYRNQSDVVVPAAEGHSGLGAVSLVIDLPNEDTYHYPDGYPTIEREMQFPDYQFSASVAPGTTLDIGETLQLSWDRGLDPSEHINRSLEAYDGRLVVTYIEYLDTPPGLVVHTDSSTVDLSAGTLDIVVGDYGQGLQHREIEIHLQMVTGFASKVVEVVPGKNAFLKVREIREHSMLYSISNESE